MDQSEPSAAGAKSAPGGSPTPGPLGPAPQRPYRAAEFFFRHWKPIAVISGVLAGGIYLTLPPSPDQFQHGYLGWRIRQGDAPYHDFIDMNWPGVMGLHALAGFLFGNHLWSWRALDLALFFVSLFFLTDLVRKFAGPEAGKTHAVLGPLVYVSCGFWVSGQHDMSAAQFLVGALWCHVRGYAGPSWRWQLGSGIFLAAAILNKPTVGVLGILLPIQAAWLGIPARRILGHTAVLASVAGACLIGAFGLLVARGASPREIIDAVYTYNAFTQFVDALPFARLAWEASVIHVRWWPLLVLGGLVAGGWFLRRPGRSMEGTGLLVLWIAGLVSFLVQRRGQGYHLAACLLSLSAGSSVSLALALTRRLSPDDLPWKRGLGAGLAAALLLGIAYKLATCYYSLGLAIVRRDYRAHLSWYPVTDRTTVAEALDLVRRWETLPPGEPVFLAGSATALHYLSERPQPTRFYLTSVIFCARPPLPMAERWGELWESDLRQVRCRYCVVAGSIEEGGMMESGRVAGALRTLLESYRFVGTVGVSGELRIYERRGSGDR